MASVRRFPDSRFFYACFSDANGRRVQISTKQSDRKKAQAMADKFEKAAKFASERRLGEAQARRVLNEILASVGEETMPSSSATRYLQGWAEKRKIDTSPRTAAAYGQVVKEFLASLANRAEVDISQISKTDVAKYRDSVLDRTSVATANKHLKYLRVALGAAYKDGYMQDNPAAKLDTLRRKAGDSVERRAFSIDELKAIYRVAEGEWKGLILFGLYAAGPRLKDVAMLTWQNVDLESRELRYVTAKTGRRQSIPLKQDLIDYLTKLPVADDPVAPIFPKAYAIASKGGSDSTLSAQFHRILEVTGLATPRSKDATGKGRSHRRTVSEISFHSLRHTATSLLKNAGVAHSVAQELVGHDSDAISRRYSHVDELEKRRAINSLPQIFADQA